MLADTLSDVFDNAESPLTGNERLLVQTFMANPHEAVHLSARELSQRSGVHESSAVRLAQKLGYPGFPALRRALRGAVQPNAAAISRVQRTIDAAGDGDLLKLLIHKEIESLLRVDQHVDQAALADTARAILQAEHVYVWAAGNAHVLAGLMERRLRSLGLLAFGIAHEGRELRERLSLIGPRDIVLAFAFRRVPSGIEELFQHCQATATPTVLIADTLGHVMDFGVKHKLIAPRGDDEEFLTLTVPMLISNALLLTISRQRAASAASVTSTAQ